ncbi:MAG: hypothetical protein P1V35_11040, partial [Planctomycetota bacterium]|nr:hypothetical protein [Planctomycetota bacterium]
TAGTMFLSANPDAVDSFMAHAASGMDTPSFYNMPGAEEIIEQLGGFQVYLYRTEAMFDSMTTLFESMLGMEDDPDLEIIADLFAAASEIAIDHLDGLIGSCASADGRIRIKTMAR